MDRLKVIYNNIKLLYLLLIGFRLNTPNSNMVSNERLFTVSRPNGLTYSMS